MNTQLIRFILIGALVPVGILLLMALAAAFLSPAVGSQAAGALTIGLILCIAGGVLGWCMWDIRHGD